jgi:hypothetical protein
VPATPEETETGKHDGASTLKQMLALGISRYHPDPRAAIECEHPRGFFSIRDP